MPGLSPIGPTSRLMSRAGFVKLASLDLREALSMKGSVWWLVKTLLYAFCPFPTSWNVIQFCIGCWLQVSLQRKGFQSLAQSIAQHRGLILAKWRRRRTTYTWCSWGQLSFILVHVASFHALEMFCFCQKGRQKVLEFWHFGAKDRLEPLQHGLCPLWPRWQVMSLTGSMLLALSFFDYYTWLERREYIATINVQHRLLWYIRKPRTCISCFSALIIVD